MFRATVQYKITELLECHEINKISMLRAVVLSSNIKSNNFYSQDLYSFAIARFASYVGKGSVLKNSLLLHDIFFSYKLNQSINEQILYLKHFTICYRRM